MATKELREQIERAQKTELVRVLTGYEDCGDCINCRFHGCCHEEEIAEELWLRGWRPSGYDKRGETDVKIGRIMQSYESRPLS
jgi:hypothetical protein